MSTRKCGLAHAGFVSLSLIFFRTVISVTHILSQEGFQGYFCKSGSDHVCFCGPDVSDVHTKFQEAKISLA